MRSSNHLEIPMEEVNDSNWKVLCYKRLQDLWDTDFGSSVHHTRFINPELYNVIRDKNAGVNQFLDVLEQLCRENQLNCETILDKATAMGGDSLLHVAAEFGREKIVELLVDHNVSLHVRNKREDTPLHVAAKSKNIEVMKIILSGFKDADHKDKFIMLPNKFGTRALHESILSKHREGFDFILNEQSESTWPLYWDTHPAESPICVALQSGDVQILDRLLQIPFPKDSTIHMCRGNSPLHAIISERNTGMYHPPPSIAYLFSSPISKRWFSIPNSILLHVALLQEMVDKKEELMYLRDEAGDTALHCAASRGFVQGVRILLQKSKFLAWERNSNYHLPIHLATQSGHVLVVKELLAMGWPLTRFFLNGEGQNILHVAAMRGQNKMVKYLLTDPKMHSEIVNEKDINGDTPLHLASKRLWLWSLLILSRHKMVNVNLTNNQGFTARDIIRMQCKIPMTSRELLADAILQRAGVLIQENLLREQNLASAGIECKVKNAANTLMLVAILIATVTFAAGFTLPGGFYSSDDPFDEQRGMVVLADRIFFKVFMTFNSVAMHTSTLSCAFLMWVSFNDYHFAKRVFEFAKILLAMALITMPVAFFAAIRLVVSNNTFLADAVSAIAFIFIFPILFSLFLGWFPLGTRVPPFRQLGYFLIKIFLFLFYGRNDTELS
ncbi:protein ACCELERATED CELL DEATH 6-like [Prosopis cineraria]|uniref:protein ACCELERATED CELL DEATH 6-like n=1 Tax=Prosopis cineraria TaxID=364024 RepID=UPI00240F73C3|nr:protein ACCELERATED CELL DEATH 6-like [Prosopis cineraria]